MDGTGDQVSVRVKRYMRHEAYATANCAINKVNMTTVTAMNNTIMEFIIFLTISTQYWSDPPQTSHHATRRWKAHRICQKKLWSWEKLICCKLFNCWLVWFDWWIAKRKKAPRREYEIIITNFWYNVTEGEYDQVVIIKTAELFTKRLFCGGTPSGMRTWPGIRRMFHLPL